jgi:hypothetical protein
MGAALVHGRRGITAARHLVALGLVAGGAGEVVALGVHVHVEGLVGLIEGAVQVSVLHRVATTTVEVAGATGLAAGLADLLGDRLEIDAADDLARAGGKLGVLGHRMAGETGGLLVLAGGVVAHQTIDVLLGREIEVLVVKPVADVAARTGLVIGRHGGAEIVDHVPLAERLPGAGIHVFPLPVLGLVDLPGGFGVAGQAGLGDLGARLERSLQLLELAVVSRGSEQRRIGRPRLLISGRKGRPPISVPLSPGRPICA